MAGPGAERARLNLVGESPAFLRLLRLVQRISACDAPVRIFGETGTGKEVVARAIHYQGTRRAAPFIPINCGAIPDTLCESELFGHVRGAFTDAREPRDGLIAQAEGGTLFLDEIEAMSMRTQVILLRFLQDQEYRPVGSNRMRKANVRIIAASNIPLESLAEAGKYRADLLFRLSVLELNVPPLRERIGDPGVLAAAFVDKFSAHYAMLPKSVHPDTLDWFDGFSWPGNVRQLENLIHRELLLSDDTVLRIPPPAGDAHALPGGAPPVPLLTGLAFHDAKTRAIEDFERAYVSELLERNGGNISAAARMAGKERSRLTKLVKKYRLDRRDFFDGA